MNKRLYLTNLLKYGHAAKYLNFSHDKNHDGTQSLQIGVTTAQLLPPLNPVSFLIKRVFYTMLSPENTGLWDCSGFSRIESHIPCSAKFWCLANQSFQSFGGLKMLVSLQ